MANHLLKVRSGVMKYDTSLKNSQKGKRNDHPNIRDTVARADHYSQK